MRSVIWCLLVLVCAIGCETPDQKYMRMRQVEQTKQQLTGKTIERVELDTGWSNGSTRSPMVLHFKEGGELKITPHKYFMDVEVKGVPYSKPEAGDGDKPKDSL